MFTIYSNQIESLKRVKQVRVKQNVLEMIKGYCLQQKKIYKEKETTTMIDLCFKNYFTSSVNIFLFIKLYYDFESNELIEPSEYVLNTISWEDRAENDKLLLLFKYLEYGEKIL